MLIIADISGEILTAWDGWCADIEQKVDAFIYRHKLELVDDIITLMGDRVITVKHTDEYR